MYRLLILNFGQASSSQLVTSLEATFEITTLKNVDTMSPVVKSWRPHLLLVLVDTLFDFEKLKSFLNFQKENALGLILIQSSYNLRTELQAYENSFDHYFIQNTPPASLKARLVNLSQKVDFTRRQQAHMPLVLLPRQTEAFEINGLTLRLQQKLILRGEKIVKLTPTQFRLFVAFFSQPDQLLTREWLVENVFLGKKVSARTVDAHIAKLKSILPEVRSLIACEYGLGYRFHGIKKIKSVA